MVREPNLQILLEVARSRLDTQLTFLDSLDTKLGLFLAVGSAVATGAAAILSVERSHWASWTWVALGMTLSAFIAIAYYTIIPLRQQRWGIGPTVPAIASPLLRHGEREATKVAINTLRNAFAVNEPAYLAKVSALMPAAISLGVETVAASAALASVVSH